MAEEVKNYVIYPIAMDHHHRVFQNIIHGLEDTSGRRWLDLVVPENASLEYYLETINKPTTNSVVVLGRKAVNIAKNLHPSIPLIVSAVNYEPQDLHFERKVVLAYTPSPKQLFKKLRLLTDKEIIHVVFNPDISQWLIDEAIRDARSLNIVLKTYPAYNLKEGAKQFKSLMQTIEPHRDAVWVIQDISVVNSTVILPLVLKIAWKRKIVVFSSRLADVNKGALFGLYPNDYYVGKRLGTLVNELEQRQISNSVFTIENTRSALNIRTAKHLGLSLNQLKEKDFDLFLPLK